MLLELFGQEQLTELVRSSQNFLRIPLWLPLSCALGAYLAAAGTNLALMSKITQT